MCVLGGGGSSPARGKNFLSISLEDSFDQNFHQENGREVRLESVPFEEKVVELETRSNLFLCNSINRKRLLQAFSQTVSF